MAPLDEVNRSPLDLIYEYVGLGSGKMKLILWKLFTLIFNFLVLRGRLWIGKK